MSGNQHDRAAALFLRVVDLDPETRRSALEEACGEDEELRREVESLLEQDDRLPSLLDTGSMVRLVDHELNAVPDQIGPYTIVEKIGAGGMGVVYRAQQEKPIRRQLALKLVKLGLETEQVLRRFDAEKRVLELLDHPGIARVLDAGSTDRGRPFFAMEYVEGDSITAFCDRASLNIEERLRLFLRVCEAVEYAHQNAVIHRDLKPSNVLVQEVSGRPLPKVIDFGIAKALEWDVGGTTLTEAGQLIGTLEYMSPEQATLSPGPIDTRADVYSLGAILYELLVGAPPLNGLRTGPLGLEESCRRLREEEPPAPSRRLATLGLQSGALAASRRVKPKVLEKKLRGDLDCIVMKALEKDRSRRYDSVGAFAADLRRQLRDEPIEARPPSGAYRLAKLMKQHRTASTVVAVLIPLLIGFAVTMLVQSNRIARERDRAEEVSEFLVRFYDVPFFVVERHGRPGADDVLLRGIAKIDEFDDRPLLQARLRLQMGVVLNALGLTERAENLLESARTALTESVGFDNPLTLAAMHSLAMVRWSRRAPETEAMLLDALAARRRVLGARHADTLRAMVDIGHFYKRAHRFEEALPWLETAAAGIEDTSGRDHEDTMIATSLLASVQMDLGRTEDAGELLEDLVPRFDGSTPEAYIAVYNLACIHAVRGNRRKALDFLSLSIERGWAAGIRADPTWEAYLDDPEFIDLALKCELHYDLVRDEISLGTVLYEHDGEFARAADLCHAVLESVPLSEWERSRWRLRLASAYLGMREYDAAEKLIAERLVYLEGIPDTLVEQVDTFWYLVQARLGRGATGEALAALDRQEAVHATSYTRARRAAIRGDFAQALLEMDHAVRRGFAGAGRLRRDLSFRPWRDTPQFEALLAEMERRTWVPSDLRLDTFVSVREMPSLDPSATRSR